jgi:hypothetical protein
MAQVQTGSITGNVTDASGAVLPGATVTLTGEKLIGGAATQVTDSTGAYRFDRLPPGAYVVKFELQGFRGFTRDDIRVNAAFVATVNAKLEVGSVSESITVTGESPTIDTKSNVQQTVLTQDVLEGVPSGRDPWSVAKLVAGLAVSTYDVGGTQSYQQSSFSAHGSSTADVSFNIDGATVNWPGGGGGSTMLYYDQGMFEEMNYMTSAIPAEVMAGGVSINMVTKDAGNIWKGDSRYSYSTGCLTSTEPTPGCLESDNYAPGIANGTLPKTFLGNPTKTTYDFNLAGGGALVKDRLWVNGSYRRWVVDKLVSAKNIDGTQAIDDNTLRNYSGKVVFSIDSNQKLMGSYNWNNKIRGHRRDGALNAPDVASLVQHNPASSTQAKYTGIRNKLVFESSFSVMDGTTSYLYQPDTPAGAVRKEDATAGFADFAAQRHEENPNSRIQFDNTVSIARSGWGGSHFFKGGVQFARLYFDDSNEYLGDMYLLYTAGRATQVREFNSPSDAKNIDKILGLFVQEQWTRNTGATNVSCVDETPPDDDTTYVEDGTVGHVDTYTVPALTRITDGIRGVNYGTGDITIVAEVGATIYAGRYGIAAFGNYGGNVTVTNYATVNGASAAIDATTSSGVVTIDNYGILIGNVISSNVAFHNEAGALWYLSGSSSFATATDALINDGTINVKAGTFNVAASVTGAGSFTSRLTRRSLSRDCYSVWP